MGTQTHIESGSGSSPNAKLVMLYRKLFANFHKIAIISTRVCMRDGDIVEA